MALTTLDIKDKTFGTKFRGYDAREVDEFLDIVVDNYETLVQTNREQENRIKALEEKLAYFDDMKESLSQSVILAQETAEKVKTSAYTEATNTLNKANNDATHLVDEAKTKANEILRDATDDAKRVAVETEELKRQTRIFHQRMIASMEAQLALINAPEWDELLQPTAVYLQNSDAAFKELVGKVLDEKVTNLEDTQSVGLTRQFSASEMEELERRVAESNKLLAGFEDLDTDLDAEVAALTDSLKEEKPNWGETQTFKLNIHD